MAYNPAVSITSSAEDGETLTPTIVTNMHSVTGSNCDDAVNFQTVGNTVSFDFLLRQCVAQFSFDTQVSHLFNFIVV